MNSGDVTVGDFGPGTLNITNGGRRDERERLHRQPDWVSRNRDRERPGVQVGP